MLAVANFWTGVIKLLLTEPNMERRGSFTLQTDNFRV